MQEFGKNIIKKYTCIYISIFFMLNKNPDTQKKIMKVLDFCWLDTNLTR